MREAGKPPAGTLPAGTLRPAAPDSAFCPSGRPDCQRQLAPLLRQARPARAPRAARHRSGPSAVSGSAVGAGRNAAARDERYGTREARESLAVCFGLKICRLRAGGNAAGAAPPKPTGTHPTARPADPASRRPQVRTPMPNQCGL